MAKPPKTSSQELSDPRGPRLRCPDCPSRLSPLRCRDVIVDKCPACQGIWFDQTELAVFKNALNDLELSALRMAPPPLETKEIALSACPRCQTVLEEKTYAYNTRVQMRRCATCQGVWLSALQVYRFIQLVKTGQEIAPHLEAALKELQQEEKINRRWRLIGALGERLSSRLWSSRWRR